MKYRYKRMKKILIKIMQKIKKSAGYLKCFHNLNFHKNTGIGIILSLY